MGSGRSLVDNFLVGYTQNKLDTLKDILDKNVIINYSTLGKHYGIENVLTQLKFNKSFDVKTVTITNEIVYNESDVETIYLMAHHLIANEIGAELYPLCFGGKYVFKINLLSNKIIEVNYSQEYQVENTLYIKDWNLAKRQSDLSIVQEVFDINKVYQNAMRTINIEDKVSILTKLFCLALDSCDIDFIKKMASQDIHLVRPKTMSYGKFEANNIDEIEDFIKNTKQYYSMDQYSIRINNINTDNDLIVVSASHLVPHRTGTKKLNVNTKYHSFFDEDITITFNQSLQVVDFTCKKITDIHYNGFELLRF